jgi:hypothetical protein
VVDWRGAPESGVRRIDCWIALVCETQSKLNGAGDAALMVHHTERRTQTYAWLGELGMIEQVEYFSAKLEASLLGYVKGFIGRKIVVRHSGNPKACVNPGFISIREGSRLREATCVEPMFSPDRTVARYAFVASWSVVWPNDATAHAEARGATSKILR